MSAGFHKAAVVDFRNTKSDSEEFVCRVHVYLVREWTGEAKAGEEMTEPTWFPLNHVPFHQMMPADKIWLPPVLAGRKIRAFAHYSPRQQTLIGDVILEDLTSS